jgi:hypothetical protein
MGMFDEIQCKMPLPVEINVDHKEHWFQTKSLDCFLDYFQIREDGSLWREKYAIEDRSDPDGIGMLAMAGCATRVNKHWMPCSEFTGEIVFYTQASSIGQKDVGQKYTGWIEFSTYFVGGQLKHFELLRYDEPNAVSDCKKGK